MLDYRWERAKRISGPSCKRLDAFGNYKVIKIKSGFSWGTLFFIILSPTRHAYVPSLHALSLADIASYRT